MSAENDESLFRQIQQSIQSGNLQAARDQIQKALKSVPGDPRLYNFLGVIDAQQRNFESAEANFRRAIEIAPRFAGAYYNLGHIYQERADGSEAMLAKALGVYRTLLRLSPGDTEATYQAASLLYRLKRFGESLQSLGRLRGNAQHSAAALSLRCANYAALNRTGDAGSCAEDLLHSKELTADDVLPLVPVFARQHLEPVATKLLEALVQNNAPPPVVWTELGTLYERIGRFSQAREALTHALPSDGPPPLELLNRLAEVAYRSGDLEGTLAYLTHARDLAPRKAATHFLIGLVCIDLKLPPEATESLREAVKLDPSNPYYHYALGAVLLQQRNPDEAIHHFEAFSTARPNDARGRFALGVALFDALRTDEAQRRFESCAGSPETRSGALMYLGRIALRQGDLSHAESMLRLSVETNASVPDAEIELALVQIRREEYDVAAKTLAAALRQAPDNYRANLYLLMLYRRIHDPRASTQAQRVTKLEQAGEERERMLLRFLDIHPY